MEAGHTFLARLGKTRLRPGGRLATEWLFRQGKLAPGMKVLEVACNMGTTSLEMARRFGCSVTACDLNEEALSRARENQALHPAAPAVSFRKEDALHLFFSDNTFDVVINEAMLTMLPAPAKEQAVKEYLRVLKPGGLLLTHDIVLKDLTPAEIRDLTGELGRAIHITPLPYTEDGWRALFRDAGFAGTETYTGAMTLLSLPGLLRDEGWMRTLQILRRGMQRENRAAFLGMRRVFSKWHSHMGFIASVSRKPAASPVSENREPQKRKTAV